MVQDDLKPYNSRPGEANIKAEQPEKPEERYPFHRSKLDEQGHVEPTSRTDRQIDQRNDNANMPKSAKRTREYRIW